MADKRDQDNGKLYIQASCSNEWPINDDIKDVIVDKTSATSLVNLDLNKKCTQFSSSEEKLLDPIPTANVFQDIAMPSLLGLPSSCTKLNLESDIHYSQSNEILPNTIVMSPPNSGCVNRMSPRGSSNSIHGNEYLPNSCINSAINNNVQPEECLSNVEEWFKQRSDSLSSLEFDSDMKQTEYDFNEFLNLKYSSQSNANSSADTSSKVGLDSSLLCNSRPMTPGNLGFLSSHNVFSDTESISSTCTDSSRGKVNNALKKSEYLNINLGLEKSTFEEILSNDILKKKIKDVNSCSIEDKGLFEELLLPNVQDWLLNVPSLDKKENNTICENDPFSVPSMPLEETVLPLTVHSSSSLPANKCSLEDYNLHAANRSDISSTGIDLSDASELQKNLEFGETMKNLIKLPTEAVMESENKLFNILDLGESKEVLINDTKKDDSNLDTQDNSINNLEINYGKNIEVSLFANPKLLKEEKHNILIKANDYSAAPVNNLQQNFINENNYMKLSEESDALQVSLTNKQKGDASEPSKVSLHKSSSSKLEIRPSNPSLSNSTTIKVKKANIPKLIIPKLIPVSSCSNIEKSKTGQDNLKKIKLMPIFQQSQSLENVIESFGKGMQNIAGIAQVQILVNGIANTTSVSIVSSNNEYTVFKINTSNLTKAILSIEDQHLEPLGLKNQQLIETSNAAQSSLSSNSYMTPNGQTKQPQIFEIKQKIQEIKAPSRRFNEVIANIHPVTKKLESYKTATIAIKEIPLRMKLRARKRRSSGDNIGISLLPGAPPTMVSVPSVLDKLSCAKSSKIELANVLSTSDSKEQKNLVKDRVETQEEKTNSALIQLGYDPYSMTPDKNCGKEKRWSCPILSCPKQFSKLAYLKIHILTHKGIRPYKCSYEKCDWSFSTSYKLKRHLETHLKRRDFVCTEPQCNRKFTTIYNLNTHVSLHKRPKTWLCLDESCATSFHTRRQLEAHMKIHSDAIPPYQCSTEGCTKAFFTSNSLASHSRAHHKDQDLVCQWLGCEKKFDKPSRLTVHMRTHTGHRPYACTYPGCNWRFHCASKLSRHQRKHTNERKYTCPICKKAFLRSEHLKGHLLTHTGIRNFQCPIDNCDAKFTAKSSLYVHLKKHKSAKSSLKMSCPFESCETLSFDSKQALRGHLLKIHPSTLESSTNQLDYITLVSDKNLISDPLNNVTLLTKVPSEDPLSLDNCHGITMNSTSDRICHQDNSGDSEALLGLSSESSVEGSMPLLVSDGLLPFSEVDTSSSLPVDLDFPELGTTKSKIISFPSGSSARTSVVGNYLLSKKAKRRQCNNISKKMLDSSDLSKLNFSNELSLSDPNSTSFQPVLMQDDGLSAQLYCDLLSDPANDPQSTINLRDLE